MKVLLLHYFQDSIFGTRWVQTTVRSSREFMLEINGVKVLLW